ncbi:MAG: tRNA dihydrouridine synthase DusB, partial [Bacteroidales bacterium]|nr:tRNA dihydrouridine synthase DusB [Bacteroidales bacterium]
PLPVLLAPLEDITDQAFRLICREYGADMVYTEFISSEGLIRDAQKSIKKLCFDERERPLGIQIFGHDAEAMRHATIVAQEVNPDLIDLNFGCPIRKVVNKGGGASLLKDIPRMLKITETVVRTTKLPVTVKTRLGWDEHSKIIIEVAERLQDCGISAITIHGRTRAQMYGGKADWTLIGEVKNNPRMHIPVIGNGDIDSPEKAQEMFTRFGVDGIMIGRAAIGNPWIFKHIKEYLQNGKVSGEVTLIDRISTCQRHLLAAIEKKGEKRAILEMRKLYGGYFRGVPSFKNIKMKLLTMTTMYEIDAWFKQVSENNYENH